MSDAFSTSNIYRQEERRRLGERIALRGALRRLRFKHRRDAEKRAIIDRALNDEDVFDLAFSVTMLERLDDDDRRPLLDLLDWFVENGDALIALIKLIIDLFSGISATEPAAAG